MGRRGGQWREIGNAEHLSSAEAGLKSLAESWRKPAPEPAARLETVIPEGLAALTLPDRHRKRTATANPVERAVQQQLERRTLKARVLADNASLLRLPTAVLVDIDKTWLASTPPCINWSNPDARPRRQRLSRRQLARSACRRRGR